MKAKDVMTTKVTTISPDNSVRQAAKVMLARRVSGLPVIDDDGGLVGLISEGDLLAPFGAWLRDGCDARGTAFVKRSSVHGLTSRATPGGSAT